MLGILSAFAVLVGLGSSSVAANNPRSAGGHLYVSPSGSDQGQCTRSAPCRTIGRAVQVAHAGQEIDIEAGSYSGQVTVSKRLTLKGLNSPVLNAAGDPRGILIKGRAAAGTVVEGMVIEGATFEAILALGTDRVLIAHNVAHGDDRGFFEHIHTGECSFNGQPPGINRQGSAADERAGGCGETIHLGSTSDSRVIGNVVTGDTGGIYLTDESGPAAHNTIAHNVIKGNLYDCGITLASHSRHAVGPGNRPRPQVGGVYGNTIIDNVANGNGTKKPGAGILVAAAFSGGAAYDNRIIDNTVIGNGLPGIALHSHYAHQDLNGNVIRGNVVGQNAIGGSNGRPGDGDAGVTHTVGILVWSFQTGLTGTKIFDNHISHDYYGVWTQMVPPMKASANSYRHVRVPLTQRVR